MFPYVVNPGMSLTMEQVVAQLQQEVITLKAHVTNQTGLTEEVRAISNRATAQVRKDTARLIDMKSFDRPMEFIGYEEDVQQWSKKTEKFLRV